MISRDDRFRGCILGLAIGDALGFQTEFLNRSEIQARFGAAGVTDLVPHPRRGVVGLYSDDTQLSVAVARALIASDLHDLDGVMRNIRAEFCEWARSPDNDRAPGQTCMDGVGRMQEGVHWFSSGDPYSKGSGAAMRAAPVGLVFSDDLTRLVEVSRAVAICTHAHPTALASAIAVAAAVAHLVEGGGPESLIDSVSRVLRHERGPAEYSEVVTHDPLGEQLARLNDARRAVHIAPDDAFDVVGAGWIGEEAVSAALYAFLRTPGDFRASVLTAANASLADETKPGRGRCDTDTIACIAGALSGAYNGVAAIPEAWVRRVEKAGMLETLAEALSQKAAAR